MSETPTEGDGSVPRGGMQVIPRPPGARPGGPAPWADAGPPTPTLSSIHDALVRARPPATWSGRRLEAPPAAVLALLYEHEGEVEVLFTRRAWHLRAHRGEVSFPGGRKEPQDPDLVATALRETDEEVSIPAGEIEIVSELDHLATVTSRSVIVPYVGVTDGRPATDPNPGEVDEVLHVPLAELLDPDAFRAEWWDAVRLDRPVYFFEVPGDTIWGATAAMLVNLLAHITDTDAAAIPGT